MIVTPCPVCGSENWNTNMRDEAGDLWQCQTCGKILATEEEESR